MTNILKEPKIAIITNLGLLLLIIPIVLTFPNNMYAWIVGMAFPVIHYGWLCFSADNEIPSRHGVEHNE